MDEARKRFLADKAVSWLMDERERTGGWMLPAGMPDASAPFSEIWAAFRALVNTREPLPADEGFLAVQDELLRGLIAEAGVRVIFNVFLGEDECIYRRLLGQPGRRGYAMR